MKQNALLKIIKERRSIRQFQDKSIPEKIVDQLIEALIWAPSAGNLQSRKFYFVFNEEIKKKLAQAALNQNFISQAHLVVVGCTDDKVRKHYRERGKELYTICDVAASIENMLLVAQEQGLGSCWVGAFDEEMVSSILALPSHLRPIAIVPLGYPAEKPLPPPRIHPQEAIEFIQ